MTELIEPLVLGLWYEDFEPDIWRYSPGRTITESDVYLFAGLTGDHAQIHTDKLYADKMPYGGRIAHGLLGLCIAQGLVHRTNYVQGTGFSSLGWDKCTFKKPILIGDTVRVRWKLVSKRESQSRPDLGIIVEYLELFNQHGEVVQYGEHISMMRKRPQGFKPENHGQRRSG